MYTYMYTHVNIHVLNMYMYMYHVRATCTYWQETAAAASLLHQHRCSPSHACICTIDNCCASATRQSGHVEQA